MNNGMGEVVSEAFVRLSGGVRREVGSFRDAYTEGKKWIYTMMNTNRQRANGYTYLKLINHRRCTLHPRRRTISRLRSAVWCTMALCGRVGVLLGLDTIVWVHRGTIRVVPVRRRLASH